MNFKCCLPLALDVLFNANERTQKHLSKCPKNPLKGGNKWLKGMERKAQDSTEKQELLLLLNALVQTFSLGFI